MMSSLLKTYPIIKKTAAESECNNSDVIIFGDFSDEYRDDLIDQSTYTGKREVEFQTVHFIHVTLSTLYNHFVREKRLQRNAVSFGVLSN